jgi:cytochrome bd ubiquinol oxidase subunit I
MTDFLALLLNPNVWVQFPHTVLAGFTTASFFVMGISAYHLRRGQHTDLFRRSFQIAAIFGMIAIVLVILGGHSQAQHMVETQPMKMAAAEALYESEDPASFSLLTIGDLSQRREVFSIRLPAMLSMLAFNQLDGQVQGINDLQVEYQQVYGPGDYIPPVAIVYWTFRIMVGAGFLLLLLAFYALFLVMGETFDQRQFAVPVFIWAIGLPYLANSAGWILTEIGRAPWVVFGLMKIEDAVSPTVSPGMVLTSLLGFTLLYGVLMAADIFLLSKFARAGAGTTPDQLPSLGDEGDLSLVGAQD